MTRTDLAVIAKSAALSMLLTLPILLPAAVSAGPDKIVQLGLAERAPALEVDGATLKVELGKAKYEAGEAIAMVATVTNPTDAPVHVAATVQLVKVPYSSPMSRMRAMPTSTFEAPVVLDLKPGETRVVRLKTDVKMGDGDTAEILASAGKSQVITAALRIGETPPDPFAPVDLDLIAIPGPPNAPGIALEAPPLPAPPAAEPTPDAPGTPATPDAPTAADADAPAAAVAAAPARDQE